MPEPVIIANRPFWARVFAVFWLIEIAVGLSFSAGGIGLAGSGESGVVAVLFACGLILAAVGVVMAASALRIWSLKGPAIEMRTDGFIDRRTADQLIPWQAISWKVVFNSRTYSLQLDVKPPEREALKVHWEQGLMGRLNRMFKYPELTVLTLGTGKTAHQLADLMARFKPENS